MTILTVIAQCFRLAFLFETDHCTWQGQKGGVSWESRRREGGLLRNRKWRDSVNRYLTSIFNLLISSHTWYLYVVKKKGSTENDYSQYGIKNTKRTLLKEIKDRDLHKEKKYYCMHAFGSWLKEILFFFLSWMYFFLFFLKTVLSELIAFSW